MKRLALACLVVAGCATQQTLFTGPHPGMADAYDCARRVLDLGGYRTLETDRGAGFIRAERDIGRSLFSQGSRWNIIQVSVDGEELRVNIAREERPGGNVRQIRIGEGQIAFAERIVSECGT